MIDPIAILNEVKRRNSQYGAHRDDKLLTRISFTTDSGRYYGPIENVIFHTDYVFFTNYETPTTLATDGSFVALPVETIKAARVYR